MNLFTGEHADEFVGGGVPESARHDPGGDDGQRNA
jgi:hypothetical protein